MLYYGVAPSWGVVWLPVLIPLTLVATLGIGVTLAALTVFYRDFKHIVPFLVQILHVRHAGDLPARRSSGRAGS